MTSRLINLNECSLHGLELGDIVTIPPTPSLTVRALAHFKREALSLSGFVILGECEMLIATPAREKHEHYIYLPIGTLSSAKGAALLTEGVASYWAPHLPSLTGAMGELPFRVIEVPGHTEPWVIVYRGPEVIVFMRTNELIEQSLSVLTMPRRSTADTIEIRRHAAIIQPLPASTPVVVPEREPARIRSAN
jgi:hypothetical protein